MNHTFFTARSLVVVALFGAFLGWWLNPNRAFGVEPYGGCDEAWQAPRSAGAQWCREHDWTVRARVVVNPQGVVVHNRLQPCRYEDSVSCYWDKTLYGNKAGADFVSLRTRDGGSRVRFVWLRDPATRGWQWVTGSQADALAEGGSRNAATRPWEECVTQRVDGTTRVACPDGLRLRF